MRAILFALAIVGAVASDAEACGRCGLFGARCRHAVAVPHVAVAPIVQASPEVLLINNIYPQPNGSAALLAQQGGTVYGYQQAALPLRVDPSETLRQAAELARGAQWLAQTGLDGYQSSAQLALTLQSATDDALARGTAAAAVLSAAGLNPATAPQAQQQTLRITQSGGKWQVEQQQTPLRQTASGGLVDRLCASCHGREKAEPAGGLYVFGGSRLSCEQTIASIAEVTSGKMPKGQQITSDERQALVAELLKLKYEEAP